jgi:acyl CoA:acetate/3-ketoacid CoA transferase
LREIIELTLLTRIAAAESLNPREVQIPGVLVDCVVLAAGENHLQTYGTAYNHAYSGRQRVPLDRIAPMQLDERKIIARRCAFELPPGGVVNLGIGMPEGVAAVAAEERVLSYITLTAEPGIIGGMPQGGDLISDRAGSARRSWRPMQSRTRSSATMPMGSCGMQLDCAAFLGVRDEDPKIKQA